MEVDAGCTTVLIRFFDSSDRHWAGGGMNKDWTVRIPVGAYAAALAGSDDPDLRFGAYALPAARKASKTSARILKRLATA